MASNLFADHGNFAVIVNTSRFLLPAPKVSYNVVLVWLLQVVVTVKVHLGYSAATTWCSAPVGVDAVYLQRTLKVTPTCHIDISNVI